MNALLLLQQVCTVIVQWGTHWLEELFCSALGELLYPPRHGSYGGFEQRLLCTLQPQPSFSPCNTAGMLTTRLPCHVHCWQRLSPPVGLHFSESWRNPARLRTTMLHSISMRPAARSTWSQDVSLCRKSCAAFAAQQLSKLRSSSWTRRPRCA